MVDDDEEVVIYPLGEELNEKRNKLLVALRRKPEVEEEPSIFDKPNRTSPPPLIQFDIVEKKVKPNE